MTDNIRNNLIAPSSEYSLIPFWFWNDDFKKDEIIRQIRDMHSKEVDGFVIHPRIGIPESIGYMSEEYLQFVKCAVEEAAANNMQVILYDEGMYPSGSAHGQVAEENPQYKSKGLKVVESSSREFSSEEGEILVCSLAAKKTGENDLDAESIFDLEGKTLPEGYTALHFVQGFTNGHIRGIHIGEDDWETPPPSSDLLSDDAVDCFIRLTHEKYYNTLSKYFGNTIIGIFTDEPCVTGREGNPLMKPWTDGFMQNFIDEGLDKTDVAALWYNVGEKTDIIRKKFDSAIEKRLVKTFYKKISDWCENHNIALVGHPADSQDIGLLKYFQIPGQDLIFRRVAPENNMGVCGPETTQAKCSSDAARHRNRKRNLNECFACSGKNSNEWTFSADDMKWMTDWLILRGVNMLIPHAFLYSMDGERRFGERPPDVGPNNIWWEHYALYSRYVKRLCWLMSDCVNTAKVAVLCESNRLPHEIVKPLYENQIEFNYLEQELLKECKITEKSTLKIAAQEYDCLLVDDATLVDDAVLSMADKGLRVIVCDAKGKYLHGNIISEDSVNNLTECLEKTVSITPHSSSLRVSCVKKDGEYFYLVVNEGEEEIKGTLSFNCCGDFKIFDPWTGVFCDDECVSLERRKSLVICAGDSLSEKAEIKIGEEKYTCIREIALDDWFVGGEKVALGSWTENEKNRDYFGTMKYETEFELSLNDSEKAVLDLGNVGEQAELCVNGVNAGVRLWAPYTFELTPYIKDGKNRICVSVSNSIANKYSCDRQPSGLLGEVKIKIRM